MNSYIAHLLKKTSAATSVVEAEPRHEHLLPNHHLKVLQSQVLWLAAHCTFPVQLWSPVKYLGMNMQCNDHAFTTGIMILDQVPQQISQTKYTLWPSSISYHPHLPRIEERPGN
jgi:hypothetical protein